MTVFVYLVIGTPTKNGTAIVDSDYVEGVYFYEDNAKALVKELSGNEDFTFDVEKQVVDDSDDGG